MRIFSNSMMQRKVSLLRNRHICFFSDSVCLGWNLRKKAAMATAQVGLHSPNMTAFVAHPFEGPDLTEDTEYGRHHL